MPDGVERWQDVATENRVRIEALEREVERQRARTHELAGAVGVVNLLAERLTNLTEELSELGERFERLSKRALERPTASGWSAMADVVTVVISLAAILLAATH